MASARFAWGIDVGNRALKAVRLVRDADQIRIDDFEIIEHETVLSQSGDNKESLIQSALANFVQRHQVKGGVVGVGVSGQQSFARFIKLPPVEPKKIPEIVRFEAIQQIPFPLDDVEWSYQLFQSPDSPDVEVGIFAMRKELINHQIKYYTDFDLNVQIVQMNPLAVYNAMHADGRIDGTTMIVDIGAENTDLIIGDTETVWMRSIPIGGNNFTETLFKAFKLPFSKAEELKRSAATSKYARQIFQAMRPIFADLVAEIQRSIGFYASVHRDSRIRKVLALGGTFRLPALQKYLQQNLQLDVERIDTIDGGAPSDPKVAAAFNDGVLSLVSAYGLALQAMGEGKITSSLLPAAIKREKLWKEKTKWFAAAAALFVAGTAVPAGMLVMQSFQHEAAANERAQIQQVLNEAQNLDRQWTEVETSGAPEREQIRNVQSLLSYRSLWSDLLGDIIASMPSLPPEVSADVNRIKQVPRGQRQQVVIDQLTSRYVPDLGPILEDPNFSRYASESALPATPTFSPSGFGGGFPGGFAGPDMIPGHDMGYFDEWGGGGMTTPAAPAAEKRGFLITIRGTSPFARAPEMLEDQVIEQLLKIAPTPDQPKREFAVVKAALVSAQQVRNNDARLSAMVAEYQALLQRQQQAGGLPPPPPPRTTGFGGRGGFGGPDRFGGFDRFGRGGFGGPTGGMIDPDDPAPFKDRLLGEDVRDDWEFTLLLAVLLDPPPPATPEQEQTANNMP